MELKTHLTMCMPRVLRFCAFFIGRSEIMFAHTIRLVRGNVGLVDLLDLRILIVLLELRGCLRYGLPSPLGTPDFVVFFCGHGPTECIGNGNEKIRRSLSSCWHISHVDKVLSCKVHRTEVNHTPFVQ